MAPNRPLPRPPWLSRGVESASHPYRLVPPRTVAELDHWSTVLANCIGDYAAAVLDGTSVLVGVERNGQLVACCELTRQRTIRQFLAARNRPVPDHLSTPVVAHLVALGAIDPNHPANRPWLTSVVSPVSQ